LEQKTGARGLRSILENTLLDTMFDLPSLENVIKVVVDRGSIEGDIKPILIYSDKDKAAKSS
jgi:ATP-dependent Clp protease ATP-binding subunit ClpX